MTAPTPDQQALKNSGGVRMGIEGGNAYDTDEAARILGRARCRSDAKAFYPKRSWAAQKLLADITTVVKGARYEYRNDGWTLTVADEPRRIVVGLDKDVSSLWIGTREAQRPLPIEFDPILGLFVGTQLDHDVSFSGGKRRPRRNAVAVVAEEIVASLEAGGTAPTGS